MSASASFTTSVKKDAPGPAHKWPERLLVLHQMLQSAGLSVLYITIFSILLTTKPVEVLAEILVYATFALLVIGRLFAWLERETSLRNQILTLSWFLFLSLLLIRLTISYWPSTWLIFALIIWHKAGRMLASLKYWSITEKMYTLSANRGLLKKMGMADLPAALAGALLVFMLLPVATLENLITLSLELLLISLVLLLFFVRSPQVQRILRNYERASDRGEEDVIGPEDFLRQLFQSGYMVRIALLTLVTITALALVEYAFLYELQYQVRNEGEVPVFLALFVAGSHVLALVIRLSLSYRTIGRLGIKRSLMILPITLFACSLMAILLATFNAENTWIFWIVSLLMLVVAALRPTIHNPVTVALFQPISPEMKTNGHTVLKGLIEPSGLLIAGLLIMGVFRLKGGTEFEHLGWVLVLLLGLWVSVILIINTEYITVLRNAIRLRFIEGTQLVAQDKDTIRLLQEKLSSRFPEEAIYAVEMLFRLESDLFPPALQTLLSHPLEQVQLYALERVRGLRMIRLQPQVHELLANPAHSLTLRNAAAHTLCTLSPEGADVALLLSKEHTELYRGLIIGLFQSELPELTAKGAALLEELKTGSTTDRMLALSIISDIALDGQESFVLQSLASGEGALVGYAIRTATVYPTPDVIHALIEFVRKGRYMQPVSMILAQFGSPALLAIEQAFVFSNKEPAAYQLHLCKIVGRIGGSQAHQLLWKLTGYPWDDLRGAALEALHASKYIAHTQVEVHTICDLLDRIFGRQYWLYNALSVLADRPGYQLLSHALELQLQSQQRQVNLLLSFLHQPQNGHHAAHIFSFASDSEYEPEDDEDMGYQPDGQEVRGSIWKSLPRSLAEKLLISSGYYTYREKIDKLSPYYTNHLVDEISVIVSIIRENNRYSRFNRWTVATAIYSIQEMSNPWLLRNLTPYLYEDEPLLLEPALYAIRRFCNLRGFRMQQFLEDILQPERLDTLMALINEKSKPLMTIEKVIILKATRLFSETPENVLIDMADLLKEERVSKGETIFKKGDPGNSMYIIYEGEIRIHDHHYTYTTLINRDFFGDMGLLDSKPRSASATAVRDSLLLRLDQDEFYELMANRQEVLRGIVQVLCDRIRNQSELISEMKARSLT